MLLFSAKWQSLSQETLVEIGWACIGIDWAVDLCAEVAMALDQSIRSCFLVVGSLHCNKD